ncbi:MAG: hypothetical protein ACRDRV_19520 [Pseudonocardiaceae bacterium]
MVTVGLGEADVEWGLASGELRCPACAGVLRPWGWARKRRLRDAQGEGLLLRPRRSRCRSCGLSHVLLPSIALLRWADLVEVIGQALTAMAGGAGARKAAERVGRSVETVRGWMRRFRARTEQLRVFFTALLVDTGADPVPPAAVGNPVADTISAIVGAAAVARSRWPDVVGEVPFWGFAAAVSHGRLLAPSWPPDVPALCR